MYDIKLIRVTPFGFVFQVVTDTAYVTQPYDIYLNGERYSSDNRNVVSIFELKPSHDYQLELRFETGERTGLNVQTAPATYVINVRDYNATGDGIANDTAALNMALYTAPKGAVVYVPSGEYLVDQLLLRSNLDIYLSQGAVIKQSYERANLAIVKAYQKNHDHSAVTINSSWEGHPLDTYASLIYGKDIEQVNIYGHGVLDGNGDIGGFWHNPKVKNKAYRPKNIFLSNCKQVNLIGITSRNSASWNIHPFYCEHIDLLDIKVHSVADSPNTDGINPESCDHVRMLGCHFSVGDDCIAIKAGKYYMATAHYKVTHDILIDNCYMEKGHGAVVIGSEMSCGVQGVRVSNCVFKDTDRGLRIKTRRGRGATATVQRIQLDNVSMDGVEHCLVLNMFYNCDPDGKSHYVKDKTITRPDDQTPFIGDISFKNVVARGIRGSAVFAYGLPEQPIQNLRVENCQFDFAPDRQQYPYPAMMCDFAAVENLGVFVKNTHYTEVNAQFSGQYTKVL